MVSHDTSNGTGGYMTIEFPSSSFSYRAIEFNFIRSHSYVFLFGGLLDVISWMRLLSMFEGQKVSLSTYLGFMI